MGNISPLVVNGNSPADSFYRIWGGGISDEFNYIWVSLAYLSLFQNI